MANKTVANITRSEFRANAKPVKVTINGIPQLADVKEFSTGSLGWFINGKISLEIDGKMVSVQVGVNLTIVGSKELPHDSAAA